MIVKNESADLGRCLKSVRDAADEIIVVDTGSTDDTVSIAESYGAQVIHEPWRDDFSFARNRSIEKATGQWIVWLDADDEVPAESVGQLIALKKGRPDKAYAFLVRNEKPGNTGSEFVQVRMFPNHPEIRFERRIHEQVMPSAARLGLGAQAVPVVVIHHGYADPETMQRKARRNVKLLLEDYNHGAPDAVMGIEIAESYTILGEHDNAIDWYKKVIAMDPAGKAMPQIISQAEYGLGSMLVTIDHPAEAESHLKFALELTPGRADALYSLAVVYDTTKRAGDAQKVLMEILTAKERQALLVGIDHREARLKAFLRLERILRETGQSSKAWEIARMILEIAPDRPEVQNVVGAMYCREGRFMDALKTFERSLELRTQGNVGAFIGLCVVYVKAGRPDTAAETMKVMSQIFTDRPAYWAFFSMVHGPSVPMNIPDSIDRTVVQTERDALISMYDFGRP